MFPWQIGVCIASRREGAPWSTIIERVEAGALGTEADWARWEASCRAGIDLDSCRTPEQWGVSDRHLGLITRDCSWSYAYSLDDVTALVRALGTSLDSRRDQHALQRLCAAMLSHVVEDEDEQGDGAPLLFQRCLELFLAQQVKVPKVLLLGILADDSSDAAMCAMMLANAASCDIEPFGGWSLGTRVRKLNEKLSAVIDSAVASDRWRDVLLSISRLPPLAAWARIAPSHLHDLSLGVAKHLRAANRLKLGRLDWESCDAQAYARLALQADPDEPTFLNRLLSHIESIGAAGPHLESFLVSLLRHGDVLGSNGAARATVVLMKLLERRPERNAVPDPTVRRGEAGLAAVAL